MSFITIADEFKKGKGRKNKVDKLWYFLSTYLPIWNPLPLYITRGLLVIYVFPTWGSAREREKEREWWGVESERLRT